MRLTTDRIHLLTGYGLTEYQARAYLALLENPMASAGNLARLSHVPRNRLYGVLEDLQSLGLVEIHLGEKRRYIARPFSTYLDKRVSMLKEQITEIETRRAYIDAVLQPMEPEDQVAPDVGTTRVIRGRRAINEEIEKLLLRAAERVVLVLTAPSAIRLESHLVTLAAKAHQTGGGPAVEIYLPRESFGNGTSERLERLFPGGTRPLQRARQGVLVLVDAKELLHVHPIPDDGKINSGNDFALYTTNRALLSDADETRAMIAASAVGQPGADPDAPVGLPLPVRAEPAGDAAANGHGAPERPVKIRFG